MRSVVSKIRDLARRAFRPKPPPPKVPQKDDLGINVDKVVDEGFDILADILGLETVEENDVEEVEEDKRTTAQEKRFLDNKLLFFVGSSNVRAARYNQEQAILAVVFSSGCTYSYFNIDPGTALSFVRSKSKGQWVWAQLRNAGVPYSRRF